MWLTTPRFLVGVGVAAGMLILAAWAEGEGRLGHGEAQTVYALFALVLMVAIVYRARARLRRRDGL